MTFTTGDFHDTKVLGEIADFVFAADDNTKILQRLMSLERGHVKYRDNRCINLIAAEAPTSPLVRKCLSSSFGYRASGGHIGKTSRCFPGMYSEKLASANIMTNKMLTPYDKDTADAAPTGIRIGTSEITRYGISAQDLKSIAHLIYDAIHADSEECIRMVKRGVMSLPEVASLTFGGTVTTVWFMTGVKS